MVVVSDATTLIVIEKRGRFDLLANLFHEVLIPTSVFNIDTITLFDNGTEPFLFRYSLSVMS